MTRKKAAICPKCQKTHPSNAAIAVGRFRQGGPIGFVAKGKLGAAIMATRAEAEADYCDFQNNSADTMALATAKEVLKSETFFLVATMDALKIVAEANGREFGDAVEAYKLQVPDVFEPVQRLVKKAAEDMACGLNDAAQQ